MATRSSKKNAADAASDPRRGDDASRQPLVPVGGYILAAGRITFNDERPVVTLKVRNTGDRPIQVGSHFHFFEANRALEFDRPAAFGMRLNIPSSTALRFEPGDERDVTLVPYAGKQRVLGFNNVVDAWTGHHGASGEPPEKQRSVDRSVAKGFKTRTSR